jgi:hypothetical protein
MDIIVFHLFSVFFSKAVCDGQIVAAERHRKNLASLLQHSKQRLLKKVLIAATHNTLLDRRNK